jgi:predicted enzyme related to lactoylglutathione lyase
LLYEFTWGGVDMSNVIHFEIPAGNPDKVANFYTEVFKWKIEKWEGPVDYWLITTESDGKAGIGGAITRKQDPVNTTVNTIDVSSVDDFTKKIIANGGKMITPKIAVPGVGYHSYCQDPEGNVFGIMQEDKSAGQQ